MQKSVIQNLMESEYDAFHYSGRGMYGKSCLAFRCTELKEFFRDLLYTLDGKDVNLASLAEEFGSMKTDSLGMDTVIYFPYTSFVEEEEEEEE